MAIKKKKTRGPEAAPDGAERRDGGRVTQPRQVVIYPCHAQGLGRPIRASLMDASPTSIGLACLGRLPLGTHFVVRLDRPTGPPTLQVYHVVRSRDAGGGACLIGAQYERDVTVTCTLPAPGGSLPAPAPAAY